MIRIIPTILIICYVIGECYKLIFKKKYHKYIPVVVSIIGTLLSILIYITNPEILNVSNINDAIGFGLINGISSTGANEMIKQLIKK